MTTSITEPSDWSSCNVAPGIAAAVVRALSAFDGPCRTIVRS